MKKTYHLETPSCITQLLTIITILISIQTISMSVIIYGIYTAYDTHKHDLRALGAVPWGDMAQDFSSQYKSIDKDAISNIIKNSFNVTQKANLLVHTKADRIVNNLQNVSEKSLKSITMIDTIGNMIHELERPIKTISSFINKNNTRDMKDIIKNTQLLIYKLDTLEADKLIEICIELGKKIISNLSPDNMRKIISIVDKVDKLINEENTKLIHDLADDADHTVQSVNKLFKMFQNKK